MSSIPPLRCFFCNHLNPSGAVFCNECGNQLTLQPCERCGAINDRDARKCHKCGSELALPAAPVPDALIAPAMVDNELAGSTLNDAVAAEQDAMHPARDLIQSGPEPELVNDLVSSEGDANPLLWRKQVGVDEAVSSATGVTATRPVRQWLAVSAALLLVLVIGFAYLHFYSGQPEQLSQQAGEKQLTPDASGTPQSEGSRPPAVASQAESALRPADTVQKNASSADGLEKAPSRETPADGAALAGRPLPATDDEVTVRQIPPIFKECPQAVATLGLCNQGTRQEQ
ncbi:MAG: zinc ribbon domain-containing protein [Polaromonas sp.]